MNNEQIVEVQIHCDACGATLPIIKIEALGRITFYVGACVTCTEHAFQEGTGRGGPHQGPTA